MKILPIINYNPANLHWKKLPKIYKLKGYYTIEKYSYKNIELGLDTWLYTGIWPEKGLK